MGADYIERTGIEFRENEPGDYWISVKANTIRLPRLTWTQYLLFKEFPNFFFYIRLNYEMMKEMFSFASRIASLTEYRQQLHEYIKDRMASCAPSLSALIGEQVSRLSIFRSCNNSKKVYIYSRRRNNFKESFFFLFAGRRSPYLSRGLSDESGQIPCFYCADSRGRKGSVQSAQDEMWDFWNLPISGQNLKNFLLSKAIF